jgi:acetolactate synthase regulatory subunit
VPLIFSPLSEAVLDFAPKSLFPKHAFVMRQIGQPPEIDLHMASVVQEVFEARGIRLKDADASTGGKDFLERILGLIRSTGFTIAIFSNKTRATAMANITLELGFAAMCGKPLVIVKSERAKAPSDFTRTDWITYIPDQDARFRLKLGQALDALGSLVEYESTLLDVALDARTPDCAIAFERAVKGFLLSGELRFINSASRILNVVMGIDEGNRIADLERLRSDLNTFVRLAQASLLPSAERA